MFDVVRNEVNRSIDTGKMDAPGVFTTKTAHGSASRFQSLGGQNRPGNQRPTNGMRSAIRVVPPEIVPLGAAMGPPPTC